MTKIGHLVPIDGAWLVHRRSYLKYQLPQGGSVGIWAAKVWTAENNISLNVGMFNLDYKRIVKCIYIYISSYN